MALKRHRDSQADSKFKAGVGSLPKQIFINHPRGPVLKLQVSILLQRGLQSKPLSLLRVLGFRYFQIKLHLC